MKQLSLQLDSLVEDSEKKGAALEKKEIVIQNKKCNHGPIMNDLREKIAACDQQMNKLEDEINVYVSGEKEKQMKAENGENKKTNFGAEKLMSTLPLDWSFKCLALIVCVMVFIMVFGSA